MTATLTPIASAPVQPARSAHVPSTAQRDSIQPLKVDTASALRPVDAASRPVDPRLPAGRDRPVGPPPAFEINVLEDLRERLADAVPTEVLVQADDEATGPEGRATRHGEDGGHDNRTQSEEREAVFSDQPKAPVLDRKI